MKRSFLHILLAACAILLALSCNKEQAGGNDWPLPTRFTAPPFLQKGDKVAVISPSFWQNDANVEQICAALEEWELVPVLGANVGKKEPATKAAYGGSAQERADDLKNALENKEIKAIFATTGGSGAIQLLDLIPRSTYQANPKWLVGFDDFTMLLSAAVLSGTMCIHGPLGSSIGSRRLGESEQALRQMLFGEVPEYEVKANPYNSLGRAEGRLVGGDMYKLRALAGTPYDIARMEDIILFLEGSGESYSVLNCVINTLLHQGKTTHIKGIIFGQISGNSANLNNYTSAEQMLSKEYTSALGIPVCYGFEAGDGLVNNPMIFGSKVSMDVSAEKATIRFQL